MMKIKLLLTYEEISNKYLDGKTAVIIDTLRATSTIVTALYHGASRVETIVGIKEACQRGEELKKDTYILCGERKGVRVKDFDLGNSPLEYQSEKIKDKIVVLSTTNGTQTIQLAKGADHLLIGSLLNRNITMEEVINLGKDLVLCCSGTQGHFSLEDFVTAGAMIYYLKEKGVEFEGDDRVQTAWLLYKRYIDKLPYLMSLSQNGTRLVDIGQQDDIDFCAKQDILPVLCYSSGDYIKKRI